MHESLLITTGEAAVVYFRSCLSFCNTISFESLDVLSLVLVYMYISSQWSGQVRIGRSSAQGHGHGSEKFPATPGFCEIVTALAVTTSPFKSFTGATCMWRW